MGLAIEAGEQGLLGVIARLIAQLRQSAPEFAARPLPVRRAKLRPQDRIG